MNNSHKTKKKKKLNVYTNPEKSETFSHQKLQNYSFNKTRKNIGNSMTSLISLLNFFTNERKTQKFPQIHNKKIGKNINRKI